MGFWVTNHAQGKKTLVLDMPSNQCHGHKETGFAALHGMKRLCSMYVQCSGRLEYLLKMNYELAGGTRIYLYVRMGQIIKFEVRDSTFFSRFFALPKLLKVLK